jgi:hypothetical protein
VRGADAVVPQRGSAASEGVGRAEEDDEEDEEEEGEVFGGGRHEVE